MTIGIDISQLAYPNVGVSNYLLNLIEQLVMDKKNNFVLFFSARSKKVPDRITVLLKNKNVILKKARLSPSVLDVLWNRLHRLKIEKFIGDVDVFITSDWTEPPVEKAKKATILYDLVVLKHPYETDEKIVATQKRKLKWVKRESDIVFCISDSTKKDAIELLNISKEKLHVIYPGMNI
jgi:hypothetical protein